MSLPGPYLLALGAWELLDNARINILERLGLARCPPGQRDLRGQVFLVTGGNAGVGKATVHDLASRGAHVIIAARSVARGNAAMQEVKDTCHAAGLPASLEVLQLDLGNLDNVHRVAQQLGRRFKPRSTPRLMAPPTRRVTVNGLEEQFQVNYLAHWLLATQVLQSQRKARSAGVRQGLRVVMVSSMTHYGGRLQWEDLQHVERYVPFQAYADSKLMNVMAALALAVAVDSCLYIRDSGVSVHPGLVDTALARGYFESLVPGVLRPLLRVVFPVLLRTPASAAKTVVFAATAPEVAGAYVSDAAVHEPAKLARDVDAARRLWDVSCALVGEKTTGNCLLDDVQ